MRPTIATAGSIHLKHTHGQRIIARSVSLDHKRSTARHRHCSFVARRVHHDRVRAPRKRILAPNDLIGQHERMRPSVDGGGHQHVHKGMGTVDQTDLDILQHRENSQKNQKNRGLINLFPLQMLQMLQMLQKLQMLQMFDLRECCWWWSM
jgi:hypothetical protein